MNKDIIKNALIGALATALYVIAIASFLFYAPKIVGPARSDTVLAPIAMLLLLVLSVAIVGSLMFAKPVLWYFDGKKQEAISLLAYTIGIFLIIAVTALSVLFFTL